LLVPIQSCLSVSTKWQRGKKKQRLASGGSTVVNTQLQILRLRVPIQPPLGSRERKRKRERERERNRERERERKRERERLAGNVSTVVKHSTTGPKIKGSNKFKSSHCSAQGENVRQIKKQRRVFSFI
jgi:hypothetical protein